MQRIARDKPGDLGTDTSRDYVYTDGDGVRRFTDSFLASLPSRTPRASRSIAERKETS